MNTQLENKKNEFVRLRIDSIEKQRLDRLCYLTRRQKSDIVREGLFELYKSKYPECLSGEG
jgi:predicted DNA-binding protein